MLPYIKRNRVTSPYGERTLNGQTSFHTGIDIVGDDDKNVMAVVAGTVSRSELGTGINAPVGNFINIISDDGLYTSYRHLSVRNVNVGDRVSVGQKIGVEGSTGDATGSHLHFEVRDNQNHHIDPTPYLGIPNQKGTYTQDRPAPPPSGKQYLMVNTQSSPLWLNKTYKNGQLLDSVLLMPKGSVVELIEKVDAKASKVNYNGTAGYAANQYLKATSAAKVVTNGSNLNLRDKPSSSGKIIAKIPNGTLISLLAKGSWANVQYLTITGYSSEKYLMYL